MPIDDEREAFLPNNASDTALDRRPGTHRPGPLEISTSTRHGILAGIWVANFLSVSCITGCSACFRLILLSCQSLNSMFRLYPFPCSCRYNCSIICLPFKRHWLRRVSRATPLRIYATISLTNVILKCCRRFLLNSRSQTKLVGWEHRKAVALRTYLSYSLRVVGIFLQHVHSLPYMGVFVTSWDAGAPIRQLLLFQRSECWPAVCQAI